MTFPAFPEGLTFKNKTGEAVIFRQPLTFKKSDTLSCLCLRHIMHGAGQSPLHARQGLAFLMNGVEKDLFK